MARYRIIEFAELDSTNRYAKAMLHELDDGDVIQASVQSAGHGRLQRRWVSHVPGNLCLSLVLKPMHAAPAALPLANLSQLLALSVCHALESQGVHASLKWPNDVLVGPRKIAGLLAETVIQGAQGLLGMVLGLGVNLNLSKELLETVNQPATSLAVETGQPVAVAAFRDTVLQDFFAGYDRFLTAGFDMIRDAYLSRCAFLGNQVVIRRGNDPPMHGRAVGLTADGALELMTPDGTRLRIDLGEMFDAGRLR